MSTRETFLQVGIIMSGSKKMPTVHKGVNLIEHAKDRSIQIETSCGVQSQTENFLSAHLWKDVTCGNCRQALNGSNFIKNKSEI